MSAASSAVRGTSAAETSDALSPPDGFDLFIDGWYAAGAALSARRDVGAPGWLRRGAGEPQGLVLDLDGDLGQGARMLPVVVGTEQQFQTAGQQHPDIGLSTAAVTAVHGGQCPGGRRGG